MDEQQRKRNIRRTTIIFVAVALMFYIGFIMMGVVRS
jgi:hypothetical protein